jgi:hypothetical protein
VCSTLDRPLSAIEPAGPRPGGQLPEDGPVGRVEIITIDAGAWDTSPRAEHQQLIGSVWLMLECHCNRLSARDDGVSTAGRTGAYELELVRLQVRAAT